MGELKMLHKRLHFRCWEGEVGETPAFSLLVALPCILTVGAPSLPVSPVCSKEEATSCSFCAHVSISSYATSGEPRVLAQPDECIS